MFAVGDAGDFRRERVVALVSLVVVAAFAWLYLWMEASHMTSMPSMASMSSMPPVAGGAGAMKPTAMTVASTAWAWKPLLLKFLMWSVMMVAMMLPSAAPAILLYGSLVKKNRERGSALPSVWVFTAGYLAVWVIFSLAATVLQAGLETGRLLTPMMMSASIWLSGGLLIAAGIYQWLPVKHACLEKCRSPLQFFLFRWRAGPTGALRMGMEHGLFCVGCCWALMLLLFAAGVMNLLWVAALTAFVLVEKVVPARWRVEQIAGVACIVWGGLIVSGVIN